MGNIYCLIGVSGSGKSTLAKSSNLLELVSHTTRAIREGEVNKVNYHYIDIDEFNDIHNAGGFIEYTGYNGNYYALSKEVVEKAIEDIRDYIVVVDLNGYKQLKQLYKNKVTGIYIKSNLWQNIGRMMKRKDKWSNIVDRIGHSIKDSEFDSWKSVEYIVDNTGSLIQAENELRKIIDTKTVYLSGKITGLKVEEYTKTFNDAEKRLHDLGFNVINPLKLGFHRTKDWYGYMACDIYAMRKVNYIFAVDDYTDSSGKLVEHTIGS